MTQERKRGSGAYEPRLVDTWTALHPTFRDFMSPDPHAIGLEIGCGAGALTQVLAPLAAAVHAVDVSAALLARAQRRLSCSSLCFHRVAAFDRLPFQRDTFDFICSFDHFLGSTDLDRSIAALAPYLKNGGFLAGVVLSRRSLPSAADLGRDPRVPPAARSLLAATPMARQGGTDERGIEHALLAAGLRAVRTIEALEGLLLMFKAYR